MKTKTLLAAALTAALGYGTSASANTIDLFDEPAGSTQVVVDNTNGVGPVANQFGPSVNVPSSIIGDYRDLVVDAISGAGSTRRSQMAVEDGFLAFSNDSGNPGVVGIGKVQWDGDDSAGNVADLDPTGLGGLDLINQEGCPTGGCDRFIANVLFADQGFEYSIGVYTDGSNYSILSANTLFAVGSSTLVDYLFEWFTRPTGSYLEAGLPFDILQVGAGPDFTNIGALELVLNSDGATVSVDLSIDSIQKTGVPEPGVLALMGLGGLVGGWVGRRRKARTA